MGDDGLSLKLGLACNFDYEGDSDDEIAVLEEGGEDGKVTKKMMCREIAKRVPQMASRIRRLEEEKKKAEEEKKKAKEVQAAQRRKNAGGGVKAKGGGGGS